MATLCIQATPPISIRHLSLPIRVDFPHYIILNLAIGGDWGGVQGIASSAFPMTMLVDHVRVSKRSENFGELGYGAGWCNAARL